MSRFEPQREGQIEEANAFKRCDLLRFMSVGNSSLSGRLGDETIFDGAPPARKQGTIEPQDKAFLCGRSEGLQSAVPSFSLFRVSCNGPDVQLQLRRSKVHRELPFKATQRCIDASVHCCCGYVIFRPSPEESKSVHSVKHFACSDRLSCLQ